MTTALGLLNWTAAKKHTSRHMIAELLRRRVWHQYFSKSSYCPSILGAWGIVVLGNGNGCGGMPTTKQSIKDSLLQECWKSALTKGLGFGGGPQINCILNEFLEWNNRDVQVFIWHIYYNFFHKKHPSIINPSLFTFDLHQAFANTNGPVLIAHGGIWSETTSGHWTSHLKTVLIIHGLASAAAIR